MANSKSWLGMTAVFVAGAGAAWLVGVPGAVAGKPKGDVRLHFGPPLVEAEGDGDFVLALENEGDGDATFALGDRIEIRYRSGGAAGDLLLAGEALAFGALEDDVAAAAQLLPLDGGGSVVQFTSQLVVPAGEARVFLLKGATAAVGATTVQLSAQVGKTTKKTAKVASGLFVGVTKSLPTQTAFYGDGSDGAPTITADTRLDALRNFTDLIVPEGVTLTVSSGTTIRCTGRFENRGTIVVEPGARGGGGTVEVEDSVTPEQFEDLLGFQGSFATTPPAVGIAHSAAGIPAITRNFPSLGGRGGVGVELGVLSRPLSTYTTGGGGGSGALGAIGGDGGGLLRVLARGPILNDGVIVASGGVPSVNRAQVAGFVGLAGGGAGGGGGGVVILASATSIENTAGALVDARGGSGGGPDPLGGGGGGGGGGLAALVAPLVTQSGTLVVTPGASVNAPLMVPQNIFAGGGGGGGSIGSGGDGAGVDAAGQTPPDDDMGNPVVAPLATPGAVLIREVDPRTLWD